MFIAQNLQNYNVYNIIFGEKTLNTIMENSSFCSVYFSNDIITMNNITLYFTLNNITIEPYFNKYKCKINNDNECIKQRLINLERLLLNKYNNIKQKTFKLQEQLNNNNLKLFSNKPINNAKYSHINVIIKISGIWESITEIGLIYKLILV
jgi:hypothetical protein